MRCPKCGYTTQVVKMTTNDMNEEYRKRSCRHCGHKFFSIEFEIEENDALKNEWPEMFKNRKEK